MNDSDFNPLALDNQLCFGLYVCSKEIIRLYAPILEPLGLTYTSYITLLSLWERDNVTVKELGARLFLDSGTLTPLLKRLEKAGYVTRERSREDERVTVIRITPEGEGLREKCRDIPMKMSKEGSALSAEEAKELYRLLYLFLDGK